MEALLLYFGKVILCSGVMFLYYQLSLKDKTFHHYNRFYLLSAMLISLLLPLIRIEDFTIEVNSDVYMLLDKIQNFNTQKNIDHGHIYFNIIFSALGLVSLYFLGKLLYGIFKIQQLKNQFRKESFDGINFYSTDLTEAPFSYFKNLFWKNTIMLNSEVGKQILKHEMVHIEQKHSFDKIFIEVITSVLWFNPFFHIIKREINLIHEYLADKKAVKHSDTKAFAQMLLASHFSGTQLPASSPFLSSNLKKRLKMLQKPKTKFGYARRIFALPVLFTIAFAYMVNAENKEIEKTNLTIEKTVSQIQKDTVRPGKTEQEKINELVIINGDHEKKLAEIEKKLKEKGKELHQLKPESKAFHKKIEEINSLAEEIGSIAAINAERKGNSYFKSDEWKNRVQELEKIGVEMPDLSNLDVDVDFPEPPAAPGAPGTPPAPPAAPRSPKVIYFKNNTVHYKDLSPKEKDEVRQALKDARKAIKESEKARRESDKMRITADRARFESEKVRIDVDKIRKEAEKAARTEAGKIASESMKNFKETSFITSNSSPKVMVMQADYIKRDGKGNISLNGIKNYKMSGWDNAKYYIDGREVSKEELDALKPENIASMNVMKENKVRGSQGEIRIQTKK
ncbi:MAG: M56 family metallopeptidase [Chryseobacterium sp.]|uniref:M56 family metallopeptidase n=1 Tax=Chryseobacterium sp. TaxID=1871047 RepID=UPI0025C08DB0|nr:M56 family metallopeptidase [Chryseobacterium sp.]MCJ7932208.1 M56 family metallopeptidase [Chryseobacterium sp.]